MTLKYYLSEEDYINFNIDFMRGSKLFRILFVFALFAFLFVINYIRAGYIVTASNLISLAVVFVIWYFIGDKITNYLTRLMLLSLLRKGKSNDFIGNQSITLADDYIEDSNSLTKSQVQYSAVERVMFGHGLYYIFIGAVKAYVIPDSSFSSEEQKKAFFDRLSEKTGLELSNIKKI